MPSFKLKIETDNAAFVDDYHGEMRKIFERVLQHLELLAMAAEMSNKHNNVRDSNGNVVGTFKVTTD